MTKASNLGKGGSNFNTSGQLDLTTGVTGVLPVANGGTGSSSGVSPGGSTTQVQYNNAGAFGGDSGFVYTGGNVGIGTASPSTSLVIADNATAANTKLTISRTALGTTATYSSTELGTTTASPMDFITSGSTRMRIDSSGNVGIGTTSPGAKLDVSGDIIGRATTLRFKDSGNTTQYGAIYADSTTFSVNAGVNNLALYSAGTERMRLDSSGNLLVGSTTNPNSLKIAATGADNDNLIGSYNTLTGNAGIRIQANQAGLYLQGSGTVDAMFITNTSATGYIALRPSSNSEKVRITANGGLAFNGASNYGSSGQVLTSNGDAPPTWGAVSVSGTAKAWVSFDNNGSIRASYNVSSIGVRGTGLWTVNFSSALADGNYAMATSASPGNTMYNSGGCFCAFQYGPSQNYSAPASSAAYIYTTQGTYTGGDARVFNPYITSCVFFR